MRYPKPIGKAYLSTLVFLVAFLWAGKADAQVKEVTVGITPSCPYGISACWSGAYEALGRLDGVKSVAESPDAYNCTARMYLKESGLPDVARWTEQFKARVGGLYMFRGVEVTVEGTLEKQGDRLLVRVPGTADPIQLETLSHKLQWNFKKAAARQPEPDEKEAYRQLAEQNEKAKGSAALMVLVTGPLGKGPNGFSLQVREFFPMAPPGELYRRP